MKIDCVRLVEELKRASGAYYNGDPIMSDEMFDAKLNVLRKMDPDNEFLKSVGAPPADNAMKVCRTNGMFTLTKYRNLEAVREWMRNHSSDTFILHPKYDGFAACLQYIKGHLIMASTRGDGLVGEDITKAVKYIPGIPDELESPVDIEIRGEIIAPKSSHGALKQMGYTAMRNAVPGIVRACRTDALQLIDFIAYDVIPGELSGYSRTSAMAQVKQLSGLMMQTEDYVWVSKDIESVISAIQRFDKDAQRYECDGIVLKTDRIYTNDDQFCPTHQLAFKYETDLKETKITGINFETKATGEIAVVYTFEPVEFQGATLTRASAGGLNRHNNVLQGQVGDIAYVTRVNDIIPMIKDVEHITGSEFVPMTHCPSCGTDLNGGHTCNNPMCDAVLWNGLVRWVASLKKGVGAGTIAKLWDAGVHEIRNFYEIDLNTIEVGNAARAKLRTVQEMILSDEDIFKYYPFFKGMAWKKWNVFFENNTPDDIMKMEIKGKPAEVRNIKQCVMDHNDDLMYLLLLMRELRYRKSKGGA